MIAITLFLIIFVLISDWMWAISMPLFVYFYKPDHLKERDGVQVGKEVLVWQREGGKHGENISEDTLWGEKDTPESVSKARHFCEKVSSTLE